MLLCTNSELIILIEKNKRLSSCHHSRTKIFPFHWWIASQNFGKIAFGYDDCVRVLFTFRVESVQIVTVHAWGINLRISFDVSQYALHVFIHGIFLFLRPKDFWVIKSCEANWNIHRNLLDYIFDQSEIWFKEINRAFLNHGLVSCFVYLFEEILNFFVHKLRSSHKFFNFFYYFFQFDFLLICRLFYFL